MRKPALIILATAAIFCFGFFSKTIFAKQHTNNGNIQAGNREENDLKLGVFSISINVKDLSASKQFYESLGFKVLTGGIDKNYVIMKNEHALIGLFHGMFQGHILTFNPGWDENGRNIDKFDDVREIQRQLKAKGLKLSTEADEKTTGPASITLTDPDGNMVLIDQHR